MPYFRSSIQQSTRERDSRRHGRVRTESLTCSLGDVMDISASGLRVRCHGRSTCSVGKRIEITLPGEDGSFRVFARPVWIRKTGIFKHEVGVCFEDLDEDARLQLGALARSAVTILPRD